MLYAFEVKVCMMFPDSCLTNNRFFLKKKKKTPLKLQKYTKKKSSAEVSLSQLQVHTS